MGSGELDYRQQAQRIELKTGGLSVSPQIIPDIEDLDLYEQVSLFLPHHPSCEFTRGVTVH